LLNPVQIIFGIILIGLIGQITDISFNMLTNTLIDWSKL